MFCIKKQKIYPVYIPKHASNCVKQVILLMIPNGEKWHYLAEKKLSALVTGLTSKYYGNVNCLNCLHSFIAENKLESHKRLSENKDFCNITIPSEDTKILEFNQYQKSEKVSFIIQADLDSIREKIDGCKNNPENSFTRKA